MLTAVYLLLADIALLLIAAVIVRAPSLVSGDPCSVYWPRREREAQIGVSVVLLLAIASVLLAWWRKWNVATFVVVQLILIAAVLPLQLRRYDHAAQLASRVSNGQPFEMTDSNMVVIEGYDGSCTVRPALPH